MLIAIRLFSGSPPVEAKKTIEKTTIKMAAIKKTQYRT